MFPEAIVISSLRKLMLKYCTEFNEIVCAYVNCNFRFLMWLLTERPPESGICRKKAPKGLNF